MLKDEILKMIEKKPQSNKELMAFKRQIAGEDGVLRNSEIRQVYNELLSKGKIKRDFNFEKLLRKRGIRTLSGIAPVAVLTKPWPCPGNCAYCPNEKNVPRSYLSNEPAVMRAIRNKYHPFDQVWMRLKALEANGHEPTKIELIVIGGTWSYLPTKYKYWFILECFRAANNYQPEIKNDKFKLFKKTGLRPSAKLDDLKKSLLAEQKKNEKTKYKLVGITLETRPDYINEKELVEMRELGCTRVEIGVQAIDDEILKLNKRGHGVAEIVAATGLLRRFGFKITYHLMPGLPGATSKKDLEMFKTLFSDERFQPDQIKFYPTVVTKGSLLYRWWKQGKYKPYSDAVLQNLIIECKKAIPEYVRIIRLIRDIPGESIEAGNMITNLRQIMKDRGVECGCIRCRECREKEVEEKNLKMNIQKYPAAGGMEYFISFDSRDGKTLYGFCRLRLPGKEEPEMIKTFSFLNDSALIRELHVYGELVSLGDNKKTQHAGLGKRLLEAAEKISQKAGFKKLAIISGVGVRGYYRKNAYYLHNGYMVKILTKGGGPGSDPDPVESR